MATLAGTVYLDGCNYQLQYDVLGQSVERNTTTVRLYGVLNVTNNYVAWDSSNKVWVHTSESPYFNTYYSRGTYTLIEADFEFSHDANGNLTVGIGYGIDTSFVSGYSIAYITFQQIKRFATITATPNSLTDEGTPYITFNNPGNATNLNVWLEVNPNSSHYAIRNLEITSGTYTWELTEQERNQLRARLSTNNTGTIRLGLYSTQGNSTSASYKDIPFSIINANPEFDNFDFEDTNATTIALTGSTTNNVINVNGYSNIKATITTTDKAEAIKQASMVKYRFSINDNSTDISYSSDSNVNSTINGAKDGIYNVYAIDSRNNSTLVTKQATSIIDYTNITFDKQHCSLVRDNNQVGENAILTLRGSFWNDDFGQVVNSIKSVEYKLKKSDSSTWITGTTTITPTTSGNVFTFIGQIASDNLDTTWDLDANYNVQVIISDELSSASVDFILNSAIPTMSLDKEGVGVMCAYDSNIGGSFQVDGIDVMNHFMTKANKTTDANGWTVIDNPTAPYIEYYKSGTAAINLPAGITWNNVVVSDLPVGVSFTDNIYTWGSVQCWDSALITTLSANSNNKMIINAVWLFGSNGWSSNHKWYAKIIKMR